MAAKSYLEFREGAPKSKTKTWDVRNTGGEYLGEIKWYAPWRRYCFMTMSRTYDAACLREIAEFCDSETTKQKASRN